VLSAPLVTDASCAGGRRRRQATLPPEHAAAEEKVAKLKQITFQPPALTFSTLPREQGSSVFYKLACAKKGRSDMRGKEHQDGGNFDLKKVEENIFLSLVVGIPKINLKFEAFYDLLKIKLKATNTCKINLKKKMNSTKCNFDIIFYFIITFFSVC
jgi:hypothetical protein